MRRLAAELTASFPTASSQQVDLLLGGLRDTFRDAPIREFLPVLMRRAARDHLSGRVVLSFADRTFSGGGCIQRPGIGAAGLSDNRSAVDQVGPPALSDEAVRFVSGVTGRPQVH